MRPIWWLWLSVACRDVGADPSPANDRFRGVKQWIGEYSISLDGAGNWKETETTDCTTTVKTADISVHRKSTVKVRLVDVDPSDAKIVWRGKGTATSETNITYHTKTVFTDRCGNTGGTSEESGSVTTKPGMKPELDDAGSLSIDFERGRYDITMKPAFEPVRLSSTTGDADMMLPAGGSMGLAMPIGDFTTLNAWVTTGDVAAMQEQLATGRVPLPGQELPPNALTLEGSKSARAELVRLNTIADPQSPAQFASVVFKWSFAPEGAEDLKLVVDPQGYDSWVPQATRDQDIAGNQITIVAKLLDQNDQPASQRATKIKFVLTSSKIPGVAMNFPVMPPAPKPDLAFEAKHNERVAMITDEGSKLEIGESITSASAVLSCFDWGAWGSLRVIAVMPSGREIVGHLVTGEEEIRIPKRDTTSHIADAWKANHGGGADLEDDETTPPGEHEGDGFSYYEEYRGFYENGEHFTGETDRKDFFIRDLMGGISKRGINLMKNISRLAVHHELLAIEMGPGRVMNFNNDGWAHLVDQHGILLTTAATGKTEAVGGPGVPKKVSLVRISTANGANDPRDQAELEHLDTTIAHELLHCANVFHHGEHNEEHIWSTTARAAGGQDVREDGTLIELRWEGSNAGASLPLGDERVIVGTPHGQHSGDDQCVMRYDSSWAYVLKTDPKVRMLVEEKAGRSLCASKRGTGVNDAGWSPQSRYFEATEKGDCRKQICVNDRYH